MLALKDTSELLEYNYKVCEISGCESESADIYESDERTIDACDYHIRDLEFHSFSS
jgi:nucleoside 2-deoxyribosyltransferase